jgi:hypothetical protein
MPIMSFLRVRQSLLVDDFMAWLLPRVAEQFGSRASADTYCVVSAGRPQPSGFILPPGMRREAGNSEPWPPYSAAVLTHGFELGPEITRAMSTWLDLVHSYRVTRTVIKDDGAIASGRPSSGIKYLRGLTFHPDLPHSAIRRSWANHANLAVDVHVGASRYVQWWVDEQLTDDAPRIGGVAELHFADEKALEQRFFDSPRGVKEIVQDLAHFVDGGPPRLFASDHVFGSPT